MQCNNCNQEIIPGSEFCGNCGAKIVNSANSLQQVAINPNTAQPMNNYQQATPANALPQPYQQAGVISQQILAPNTAPPANVAYAVTRQNSSGLSIASMVLGIISILSFWTLYISIPLGILAIIFGFIGRTKGSKGMALAGIITGALGTIFSILFLLFLFWAHNFCINNPEECNEPSTPQMVIWKII